MSLFQNMFKLRSTDQRSPKEDFLSEVFAGLLRSSPELTQAFIQRFVPPAQTWHLQAPFVVETQARYSGLTDHLSDSRIDLTIRDALGQTLIMIESKLGSTEGNAQLRRYWELLVNSNATNQALLYITQHHDPKESFASENAIFEQYRWEDVAQFLQAWAGDYWVDETLAFMKELNLLRPTTFTDDQLHAFQHAREAFALMKTALSDSVEAEFVRHFGKTIDPLKDFLNHRRYALLSWSQEGFEVAIGFQAPSDDYPDLTEIQLMVWIGGTTKSPQIAQALSNEALLSPHTGWKLRFIDSGRWKNASKSVPLKTVLDSPDHVSACKVWFESAIEELQAFKAAHPELPWAIKNDANSTAEPASGVPLS